MEIRNIAIIAHVDHGKTTLTDALLKQTGVGKEGASMDSNALEQERGITIYAKNTSIPYKDGKINIVDTPGHADFGSEVERVLRSIDSVLLVVDAQEGPMPQTRFVLKKSLEIGLRPIVVINKIDKPAADPARAHEQVLELFFELGASEIQSNFPVVYSIGRQGIAKKELTDIPSPAGGDLTPLLDTILEHVPSASTTELAAKPLRLQPFNLAYDNFLGRMAVARLYEGVAKPGVEVFIRSPKGEIRKGKLLKLFTWKGMEKVETLEAIAGDIALIAGLTDIEIGETVSESEDATPLPVILIDEPTIELMFLVNNSPFGGRDGKYVTSRQIREYLSRELEVNVGLKIDFSSTEYLKVRGRGELHIAILLENMRRAGYEIQVSQPQVIIREENGVKTEPFEEVIVDIPQKYQGAVIEKLGRRAFIVKDIRSPERISDSEIRAGKHSGAVRLILEGPTRGILGYRSQFIIDTRGEGIMSSRVIGFKPHAGEISKRAVGSMISMATGKALGYALWGFQERGALYIGPGTPVYEGMVIGNTSKGEEMTVNPTKGKQLTNVRASGTDEAIDLVPPFELTIERGLEVMAEDEYLEITPKHVRLRKKYLTDIDRSRAKRKAFV
ncbi:MAG: GTP-binding protein TypA [Candidatus Taylorbacteria bacterium RIFCSPHIGHO2_02_49_25]|uniref:GTP-binding protein TypA n=1 Tax=Candidatus Taylorbacteria bacterium RIFCSPHIGHO2_02_49_25 TaxID=1802305 RepID=A0A1G2MK89_9BACT|nr:MAG: GTP-binding protein TypA/BipA [Parcubacteria group bacterium GW2011_GWF2_50_9]OHA19617.1 MAG: GTP-binding protein TypA [Candidatus Taylorbacteria bacterium RIFCSPHIGHO2_01_FULL_49_60]OHA23402.1 MAG: GTP-binding protein TypA [Candidatus Taylorbacteria bacterium RIFCSPHIGHO2_02_49_25]OHA36233.1 MAG: GTP-binding protein TypA [Candidatus Taylorbacteria bacterium RIFCSPLOWO2_02_50_13]OHA36479.1 MAG: GTP-binding protein TypA [Candidatus Taylorbacteria bacterium RIFCSPLOWO2_01_FULL_50_130]OHA